MADEPAAGRAPATPRSADHPERRTSVTAPAKGLAAEARALGAELDALRESMLAMEETIERESGEVHPEWRVSARNFGHYLALRQHDVRRIQGRLARLGLSSLGRTEGHVLANVDMVRHVLHALGGERGNEDPPTAPPVEIGVGRLHLDRNAGALLGPPRSERNVRIMVTLGSEVADAPDLARDLVRAGMDLARINCAHDDAPTWRRMAERVRTAAEAEGRSIRILMDLPGPKLRTGEIEPGPPVLHWKPHRDDRGQTVQPARVWLGAGPAPFADATLNVDPEWWRRLEPGDVVRFKDLRGRNRRLFVVSATETGCGCEAYQTAWLEPGVRLTARSHGRGREARSTVLESVPATPGRIRLHLGDALILTRSPTPGRSAVVDASGHVFEPARVPCTLPRAFERVEVAQAVWLDDGRIGGIVRSASPDRIGIEITHCPERGTWLRADKGINLPETELEIEGMTAEDEADLQVAAEVADIVGLSFVEGPAHVLDAWRRLRAASDRRLGLLVKIETQRAFERLSRILLAAFTDYPVGVMIARGDLAVECGFERLAEVQEEILWMCEAAHVPVVWATQVLENLAKTGLPTRAEVTDAAMSERAECVMLNKGPQVVEAVRALGSILSRMEGHQRKKVALLRPLSISALDTAP